MPDFDSISLEWLNEVMLHYWESCLIIKKGPQVLDRKLHFWSETECAGKDYKMEDIEDNHVHTRTWLYENVEIMPVVFKTFRKESD